MDNEEIAREHQLVLDLAKSNKRKLALFTFAAFPADFFLFLFFMYT